MLTSELDANVLAELVERQLQARGVNGAFFRQSEGFRRFAANLAAPNHPPLRSVPRALDEVGPGVRIRGTLAVHVRDLEHRRGAGDLQTRASHRGGDEVGDDNNDRRADVREHGTRMRTTMGGGFDAGESGGPRGGVESEYEQHRRREVTTEHGHAHHQQHEEEGISEGRGVVRQAQVTAKVIVTCDLVIERTEISTGPGETAQFAAPPPIHVVTEVGTIVYATGEAVVPGGGRVGSD